MEAHRENDILSAPIAAVKGVGAKRIELFRRLGVSTLRDMLFFCPRAYKDFSDITPCAALTPGERCALVTVSSAPTRAFPRGGLSIVSARGNDETGRVTLIWYNQPYMYGRVQPGAVYLVYGKVEAGQGGMRFVNASLEEARNLGDGPVARGIVPFYPLTAGLTQKIVRQTAAACLELAAGLEDPLPYALRERHGLRELSASLKALHAPASFADMEAAWRRLALEELIFFQLAVWLMKRGREEAGGVPFRTAGLADDYIARLPFAPTLAQRRVIGEIETDMAAARPMNRLVQGDVGCGKTALAFYALFVAAQNGYQGAYLAPTEILARQHYDRARAMLGNVALLTGGTPAREKKEIYAGLASGEIAVAVGTHALLTEAVEFNRLGLVVTDEQHRFGVAQRAAIARKGDRPDILVMSATPIPRTLSLMLYGDLDISVVDGMPPGRQRVSTHIVPPHKRDDMYGFIKRRIAAGEQAYVVCPLLEESEEGGASVSELYAELTGNQLRGVPALPLHGRMSPGEKFAAIEAFRSGEVKALVSTTVVEVGVDVPGATIIAIEDADRFGLAQLHQLRGRVGRGGGEAYCFLLSAGGERLEVMTKSCDGFEIAMKDLEMRGPGEFLGTRQSGGESFRFLRFAGDIAVFETARAIAREIMEDKRYAGCRERLLDITRAIYERKLTEISLN